MASILSFMLFAISGVIAENTLGKFYIEISAIQFSNPTIIVTADSTEGLVGRRVLWESIHNQPFLIIGDATELRPPILNGNYQVEEVSRYITDGVIIDSITNGHDELLIKGQLLMNKEIHADNRDNFDYTLSFSIDPREPDKLSFSITTSAPDSSASRLYLRYQCHESERFFGFGESFTFFDLKSRRVPIVVSEQGVGRGVQPLTDHFNEDVSPGAGGDWATTYAPKPLYLTDFNRSVIIDGSEIMFFNMTKNTEVEIEVWATNAMSGWILNGESMLDLVELITSVTGRQGQLPQWTQEGAIVGLEGGTENVTKIVDLLLDNNVPVAGVWLQDWVGLRHSWDGDRLIWNWEVNYDYYPGWDEMVDRWTSRGTRTLTYLNPFFSDPSNFTSQSMRRHNFYQEGIENGYFVKHADGSPYLLQSLSIQFAQVDLSNPSAWRWMKNIVIDQSIEEAGSSGWMCDFGEYLPFDAVLYSGESPYSYHNRYPQLWAKLTKEAILEANNRQQQHEAEMQGTSQGTSTKTTTETTTEARPLYQSDILYFMRSAWTNSPAATPVFWLGDQLMSWDKFDGLKSVVVGALSGGLSGHAITHSDIGGYNAVLNESTPDMFYTRTPELLKRWTELAAFGFGIFRTHIGNTISPDVAQIYDSPDSMAHFAEFTKIFVNLTTYRQGLMDVSKEKGYPLIRPMAMHYAYDPVAWNQTEQFLVGEELLIAPCMDPGADMVTAYFPAFSGEWHHVWSDVTIKSWPPCVDVSVSSPSSSSACAGGDCDANGGSCGSGRAVLVPSPIGFPAVFYKGSSQYGRELKAFLLEMGFAAGYEWVDPPPPPPPPPLPPTEEDVSDVTEVWGSWQRMPVKFRFTVDVSVLLFLFVCFVSSSLYCSRWYFNTYAEDSSTYMYSKFMYDEGRDCHVDARVEREDHEAYA